MTGESDSKRVPRLLRLKEVAQLTGVDAWRWYEVISKGKGPPHMRMGKTIRIAEDVLVEWIEQQHQREAADARTGISGRRPVSSRRRPLVS